MQARVHGIYFLRILRNKNTLITYKIFVILENEYYLIHSYSDKVNQWKKNNLI